MNIHRFNRNVKGRQRQRCALCRKIRTKFRADVMGRGRVAVCEQCQKGRLV